VGPTGGLNLASGLAFGPDGNLYVGSYLSNQVRRYNGTTGAFIDVFAIAPTAGPLLFGPDGNLYVGLVGGSDILRFDGTTGAPMGSFIPAGDTHPQGPRSLIFRPDGNLYVSSRDTDQVLRYDGTSGAFIDSFASGGVLDSPSGLAFVPEPWTLLLLCSGLAALGARRRLKRSEFGAGKTLPNNRLQQSAAGL
jgi:DNA-binding beta-propeller fold protein YncE